MVFNALGHTDELNACIGVAKEYCISSNNGLAPSLSLIQSRLLDLGSAVATPRINTKSEARIERTSFPKEHVDTVEEWIDQLDVQLPQLKTFILPSGGLSSANLHVARAVCRRAERSVVPLVDAGEVEASVQKYLNRLSDFFSLLHVLLLHTMVKKKLYIEKSLRGEEVKCIISKKKRIKYIYVYDMYILFFKN